MELNLRNSALASISRIHDKVSADDYSPDHIEANEELTILKKHYDRFMSNHWNLVGNAQPDELAAHEILLADVEEQFKKTSVSLQRYKQLTRPKDVGARQPSDTRLDPVSIPQFDGNPENWLAFKDLFESLVHSRNDLDPAFKLGKLRQYVSSDLVPLVGGLYTGGYEEVWTQLNERYDNNRLLSETYVKRILTLPNQPADTQHALQQIIDTVRSSYRALAAMSVPTGQWDALIVPILKAKMPTGAHTEWGMSLRSTEIPKLEDLLQFLERRAINMASDGTIKGAYFKRLPSRGVKGNVATTNAPSAKTCANCGEKHLLAQCKGFMQLALPDRWNLVRKSSVCFNCLRVGHRVSDCKSRNCLNCNQRHHTRLCKVDTNETSAQPASCSTKFTSGPPQNYMDDDKSVQACVSNVQHTVLLATAQACVVDRYGNFIPVRILFDPGSQASFMTEAFFNKLGLKRQRCEIPVEGIGGTNRTYSKGQATVTVKSTTSTAFEVAVNVCILQVITTNTPSLPVGISSWPHLKALQLADITFGTPGGIDMLIGADVWGEFLKSGVVKGKSHEPVAVNTHLGWVVFGPTNPAPNAATVQSFSAKIVDDEGDLLELLRKFWEVNDPSPTFNDNDDLCNQIYARTVHRDSDGRYSVQIPFQPEAAELGSSHPIALRQFHQLERRLTGDAELRENYVRFMREYESLNHMEPIPNTRGEPTQMYFIPHHAVNPKFRVVFNASAKTTNNISLNDTQMIGPTLQDTLINIILRFRRYRIAISADIKKMFRQIEIDPRHRCWQQILWREFPSQKLQVYQLKTVTYGMASSPYLAIRTLRQCADDGHSLIKDNSRALNAKQAIFDSFYMDDYLDSLSTTEEAITLGKDVSFILQQGRFELCKWNSNDNATLLSLSGQKVVNVDHDLTAVQQKVLGLYWNPIEDEFLFKVNQDEHCPKATKRNILSHAAKVYDPLGMLAPITVRSKMLIQRIWQSKLHWDDVLPDNLATDWWSYYRDIQHITTLRIPRWTGMTNRTTVSLHGFCDASKSACSAVVYLRSRHSQTEVHVSLIIAKTKVAPLAGTTIPRLELAAAVLLVDMLSHVRNALRLQNVEYHLYTDSSIVLCWIKKSASSLKQYVSNRVKRIQDNSDVQRWRHVSTSLNPADVATRGISPKTLASCPLWWTGPRFLSDEVQPSSGPMLSEEELIADKTESKGTKVMLTRKRSSTLTTWVVKGTLFPLVDRFSTIQRLLNTTAIIFRWKRVNRTLRGQLITAAETEDVLQWHIRECQHLNFQSEISALKETRSLPKRSCLQNLKPFIDPDGILRVGGRLDNAGVPYTIQHPIILPKEGNLIQLLINDAHKVTLHGGIQQMLHHIRLKFWIIYGRSLVKSHIHRCVVCRLHRAAMQTQQMATLPRSRLMVAPPFTHTGLDYFGPFNIRLDGRRTATTTKTYGVIFVCMTTKAVHIELAEDLSTRAFLDVFDRFVSRRGYCNHLYSDNGTQLVGAERILREEIRGWNNVHVQQHIHALGVNWQFITPAAPHHGGLWEAAVRSAKKHLVRVIGRQSMRYQLLNTLLVRIEACLNSRPLIALHDDPHDKLALTPGDFLIGRPLLARPEPSLPAAPDNRLKYWQLLQRMQQHFWQQWSEDYLAQLQTRAKWSRPAPNMQVDDVVAIKSENLPPTRWRIGRISEVHPGSDGLVRTVTVKCKGETPDAGGTYSYHSFQRPVQKICRLLEAHEGALNRTGSAGQDV